MLRSNWWRWGITSLEVCYVAVAVAVAVAWVILHVLSLHVARVASNSMRPVFSTHDAIVFTSDYKHASVGAVVVYRSSVSNQLVAHRIVQRTTYHYVTQGDALSQVDTPIRAHQIAGQVVANLSGFGDIASILISPYGFVLFCCVPLIAVFTTELYRLLRIRLAKPYSITHRV